MAQRAGVGTLVLTHMVPSPATAAEEEVLPTRFEMAGLRASCWSGGT